MYAGRKVLMQRPDLAQLAIEQSAVLTRDQLALFGVDSHCVARHVAAGRWRIIGPAIVVTHLGPLPEEAKRWAAVLNAGRTAALCGWTALAEAGLGGWHRDRVHVVVPRGWTPAPLPWVRVHESRRHSAADVSQRPGRLPTHRPERAAVDAAAWERSARSGCGLLAAVVQQRIATVPGLFLALDAAGRVRHRRVLAATLRDIEGGADALSEIDLGVLCEQAGLPRPLRQSARLDLQGRQRFRDIEWVRSDGRSVIGEIDGIGHSEIGRWYDDLMRDAELARSELGAIRFRLPAAAVRTEPQRVLAILRSVLLS